MTRIIGKIVQSKYPPKDSNVLWDDGENLKISRNGNFENVVSTTENNGTNCGAYDDTEIKDKLTELAEEKVNKDDVATVNGQSIINGGNITIEGEKGEKGDKGDQGPQGATGPQGEPGPAYNDTAIKQQLTELAGLLGNKADKTYVDEAIAAAITTTLNSEV